MIARLLTRRKVIATAAGIGVLAAGGLAYEAARLGPHRPEGPYGDLLPLISERQLARRVGAAFLAEHPNFTAANAAKALRLRMRKRSLEPVLRAEIAQSEIAEAGHWIIPRTLAELCALSAAAAQPHFAKM